MFGATENEFMLSDLFNNKKYLINLIIIIAMWCASSICFFIIGFYLKYIPGNVFQNVIIVSVADQLSSVTAGILAQKLGAKNTIVFSFALAAISAPVIIFYKDNITVMISILVTRYGINSAFTLCFIVTTDYFPSIVSSQVFGFCNIFSRLSTALAPLLAEMEPPLPILVYTFICVISLIFSLFLSKNESVEEAFRDLDDTISIHSYLYMMSAKSGGKKTQSIHGRSVEQLSAKRSDSDKFQSLSDYEKLSN